MPKYKKVKPEITEGFLDRFFAKIATNIVGIKAKIAKTPVSLKCNLEPADLALLAATTIAIRFITKDAIIITYKTSAKIIIRTH